MAGFRIPGRFADIVANKGEAWRALVTALRVDCYCRLHPPETRATLSANFRDRTLAAAANALELMIEDFVLGVDRGIAARCRRLLGLPRTQLLARGPMLAIWRLPRRFRSVDAPGAGR